MTDADTQSLIDKTHEALVEGQGSYTSEWALYHAVCAQVYATLALGQAQQQATEFAKNQLVEIRKTQEDFLADLRKELEK